MTVENIEVHKQDLKSTAYKTLARPQLEYASTAWSPHTATDIQKIESVQRMTARWPTREYRFNSSVTSMLNNINWRPLEQRRIDSRLAMLYKVTCEGQSISSDNRSISQKYLLESELFVRQNMDMGVAYSCLKYDVFITTRFYGMRIRIQDSECSWPRKSPF